MFQSTLYVDSNNNPYFVTNYGQYPLPTLQAWTDEHLGRDFSNFTAAAKKIKKEK